MGTVNLFPAHVGPSLGVSVVGKNRISTHWPSPLEQEQLEAAGAHFTPMEKQRPELRVWGVT